MKPFQLKLIIIAILCVAMAAVAGILFTQSRAKQTKTISKQIVISEMNLAGVRESAAGQKTQALQYKREFTVGEKIALRVVSSNPSKNPFTLSIRLLDSLGRVHNLSPATISIKKADDRFCCWTVGEKGSYTLQVFRPDNTIVSLPLTVL